MGQCASKNIRTAGDDKLMDFTRGNVHLVTTEEDWDRNISKAVQHGRIVIVNFTATWCSPCRVIAPFYSDLSEMHPSIMFLMVDVDELM
ncbi:hypothetical protein MLD38_038354 [Melastoma candidum]|uniref:Uncharacterized protein n=1 Tax=Melastoma candidum TaxID=119954 RepID=A0ACB9KZU2_9MYRT|nr:hypothetical protein MLD38_038354 [Melastoma candidum]